MALAPILPDRVPGGWNRWNGPSITGVDPRNDSFYVMFGFNGFGGAGAAKGADGRHYIGDGIDLGGLIAPNIETNEVDYPHITEFNEFTTDSCGAGEYIGGCGARYRVKFYDKSPSLVMFGDGRIHPPYGLFGGKPGSCNMAYVNEGMPDERLLPAKGANDLKEGDTFTSYPSGGGGWGDPHKRPAEQVRMDVKNGYISLKNARETFGVVLEGNDLTINEAETKKLRGC